MYTSHHSGINQSPYLSLFDAARVGLRSTTLPTEIFERMVPEEDLLAAFDQTTRNASSDIAPYTSTIPAAIIDVTPSTSTVSAAITDVTPSTSTVSAAITDVSPSTSTASANVFDVAASMTADDNHIKRNRKQAQDAMICQAKCMVKRSRVQHVPGNIGDNVTIPIPLVDRGRSDPRNIIGVIVDRDINDMYGIAVRVVVLKGKYS